jgi:DNA-binding response OmpR family regulator
MDGYTSKPLQIRELLAGIERVLASRNRRQSCTEQA